MTVDTLNLDIGDWIVHTHRGVGQVKSIEKKKLGDVSKQYFKIRTHNSIYWIPVDRSKSDHIRPVIVITIFGCAHEHRWTHVIRRGPR